MEATVQANIQYPTFKWLASANITPSNTTNYNISSIEKALANASGAVPYVSRLVTDGKPPANQISSAAPVRLGRF